MRSDTTATVANTESNGATCTVWVGAPAIGYVLAKAGPILVVEADSEKAQELRQALRERPDAQVYVAVLTPEKGASVRWHRFNDRRLDGPEDVMYWQERFPNLRQIGEEERCGERLEEILDKCIDPQQEGRRSTLQLILRQGNALSALKGMGKWVEQLQLVQLSLPRPNEILQQLNDWLTGQNMRLQSSSSLIWYRDPVATIEAQLREKEQQQQALINENIELRQHLKAIEEEHKTLLAEYRRVLAQVDELTQACETADSELQQRETDTHLIQNEHEALRQECERLSSLNSELLQRLEAEFAWKSSSKEAFKKLIPIELYQDMSADFSEFSEQELIEHYLSSGLHDSRLKTYQELWQEQINTFTQCQDAVTKLTLLEDQFSQASQQLDTLKELLHNLSGRMECHDDQSEK